eukprot:TRINITY_DN7068_c0_g2_i13.p1 TRINITY_DN7068_c0_g2~~TRINITY_DN7068_c0_g2_i13.p1  ORF type:complete len:164 (+),score=23.31 TRINITY_DN7068_c0_g2_i13:107-598(+)
MYSNALPNIKNQLFLNVPYQDLATGAHFSYRDMCRRLMQLQCSSFPESLDEWSYQIAEEQARPDALKDYQSTGCKKFLGAIKSKFPRARQVAYTFVKSIKQRLNTGSNIRREPHGTMPTLETEKNSLGYAVVTRGKKLYKESNAMQEPMKVFNKSRVKLMRGK